MAFPKSMSPSPMKRVTCLDNTGYPASLEKGKTYVCLSDADAEQHRMVRVIDESGEDYLYAKERFKEMAGVTNPKYPPKPRIHIDQNEETGAYIATSPDVPGFEAVSQSLQKLEDELISKYIDDLYAAAGQPPPAWELVLVGKPG